MGRPAHQADTTLPQPNRRVWLGPLIVALVAFFAVIFTLDPDESCDYSTSGPGITIDESFNVQMGVYLSESAKSYGLGLLDPETQREIFERYNPDHPPLGRFWLGTWHALAQWIAPANVEGPFVTVSARWGSAAAFACTIFMVGVFADRRFGGSNGLVAAISLLLMPRLFAHAHLAALESITNLVWTASLLSVAYWWTRGSESEKPRAISNRTAVLTGVVLGLALLTKIQAIILPPLVACWAVWHWRAKAIRPLCIWATTGFAVFCLGWPYLWFDFVPRITEYFASTSDRAAVNVWYMGQQLDDRAAPWHYPWVMFCATIPIGLLACGVAGMVKQRSDLWRSPAIGLVFGAVIAPLILFSIPGVAVYDGTRLFLVSFPAFCIFVGIGFRSLTDWLAKRTKHANVIAYAVLAAQAVGLVWLHPFQLSYYNGLVGGTAGAVRLGFEPTYWGDSINSELIEQLPDETGAEILVAPQLHQFQAEFLAQQCPRLARQRMTRLDPLAARGTRPQLLLLFHRRANAPTEPKLQNAGWSKIAACRRQGVELSSIWSRK